MSDEPTHKYVNGELVELTKEEIAQIKKDRAAAEAAQPPRDLDDRLDEARERRDDRRDDRRQDRRDDRREDRQQTKAEQRHERSKS